ncbi:MAG: PDZ domain-containing protein [Chitinophagaceae bacterium]|nr:PDZ domain-containing protein [Chitinophagaceae bacterium]
MNKLSRLLLLAVAASGIFMVAAAQDKEKTKTKPGKKEEITIRKRGDGEKMTIVIDGENITVNGKPLAEYSGDDIVIRKKNIEGLVAPYAYSSPRISITAPRGGWNMAPGIPKVYSLMGNRAFLGVVTEKGEDGVKVKEVMKESAAEKAGLKEGDIITKLGDKKIEDSDDLYKAVSDHKPGDEVELTYLRNKKETKLKVKLGENKSSFGGTFNFRSPRLEGLAPLDGLTPWSEDHFFNWSDHRRHRLGIRIQDTEDDKGVKVLEVEEESLAAKAGIKRDDVVIEIDGKNIKDADDAREALADAREKTSYSVKVLRSGTPVTVEIKVPKNLKKADL